MFESCNLYNEGLLCQNLLELHLEDYLKCCSNINLMRTIPKLYKMLHFTIQRLRFCLSQINIQSLNLKILVKIKLHFYPKTENMFFKVEGSL